MRIPVYMTLVYAVLATAPLKSQTLLLAPLTLQVTDVIGAVIPEAAVTLSGEASQALFTETTNQNGEAHFALPSGHYKIEINATGFKTAHRDIELRGMDQLALTLDVGNCTNCVEVSPGIQVKTTQPVVNVMLEEPTQERRHARRKHKSTPL